MVMETRAVGKSEVSLSELTLGTWGLSTQAYGATDVDALAHCVKFGLEVGYASFDCSPHWGEGESERMVGKMTGHDRDAFTYITRVQDLVPADSLDDFKRSVNEQLERSLKNFGTDYVDILLLNHPPPERLEEEGWASCFEELTKKGTVRAWGLSTSKANDARLALSAKPDVVCLPFNLLHTRLLDELGEEIDDADCKVIARSPLAYGMLADGWDPYFRFRGDDHRQHRWSRLSFEKRLHQVTALRFLLGGSVDSMVSAALRYVLSHPAVATAAIGVRDRDHVYSSVKMLGEPPYFSEEDLIEVQQILAATDG